MKSLFGSAVLAAVALIACGPAAERPAADAAVTAVASGDSALVLERTPCFGFCPVYLLVIDSTGHGTLEGRAPTASFRREVHLSADSLRALLERMDADGFFGLDSAYTPGHRLCEVTATDHPGAIITVAWRGRRHEVRHYLGCYVAGRSDSAPTRAPELLKLVGFEDAIDSLAGVGRWVDSLRGR